MKNNQDETPTRFWAGGFLYNPKSNAVLLHQRDGNTKINPYKWAFFGGLNEGEETPEECFMREMKEELDISITRDSVSPLRHYLNVELNTYRFVFFVSSDVSKDSLVLGEGAGFDWINLSQLARFDLTDKTLEDLDYFVERIASH